MARSILQKQRSSQVLVNFPHIIFPILTVFYLHICCVWVTIFCLPGHPWSGSVFSHAPSGGYVLLWMWAKAGKPEGTAGFWFPVKAGRVCPHCSCCIVSPLPALGLSPGRHPPQLLQAPLLLLFGVVGTAPGNVWSTQTTAIFNWECRVIMICHITNRCYVCPSQSCD